MKRVFPLLEQYQMSLFMRPFRLRPCQTGKKKQKSTTTKNEEVKSQEGNGYSASRPREGWAGGRLRKKGYVVGLGDENIASTFSYLTASKTGRGREVP